MTQQIIGTGSASNDGTGDPLRTAFTKSNSNFSDLYSGVYTRYFDTTQYGTAFDGTSDIAAGVQAAIDAARTFLSVANGCRCAVVVIPPGLVLQNLKTTLNLTGFTDFTNTLIIKGNRTGLLCSMNGMPAIDAMGSQNIWFDGLHLSGVATSGPNIGIQYGRLNTGALNDGGVHFKFIDCRLYDHWSFTPLYAFTGESCFFENCVFGNSTIGSNSFAAVFDGINHWGVTSAFVTQSAPANTPQSYNQNYFIRCDFFGSGSATQTAVIWKSFTRQHEWQSCYVYAQNTYAFLEYCVTGGVSSENRYDLHIEGSSTAPAGYFLFDGTLSNPVIGGFDLKVAVIYASRLFKTQGSITSIAVRNLRLNLVGQIVAAVSASFQVFDNASLWTVSSGSIDILDATYWNYAAARGVMLNGVPHITCDM